MLKFIEIAKAFDRGAAAHNRMDFPEANGADDKYNGYSELMVGEDSIKWMPENITECEYFNDLIDIYQFDDPSQTDEERINEAIEKLEHDIEYRRVRYTCFIEELKMLRAEKTNSN